MKTKWLNIKKVMNGYVVRSDSYKESIYPDLDQVISLMKSYFAQENRERSYRPIRGMAADE